MKHSTLPCLHIFKVSQKHRSGERKGEQENASNTDDKKQQ